MGNLYIALNMPAGTGILHLRLEASRIIDDINWIVRERERERERLRKGLKA